ncbi:MAG: hypothetical protein P9F19_08465 [Candidatus Contendobacter sp.]|nr:hypothetical protein [Candidatus Contendobacter sp.]MDG4557405.1 hypothetical protein [Candidatus Contendobacter sp.]
MKSLAMMTTLLMLSSPVWAGGSVEMGGNYESKVRTKDNYNAALGMDAVASQNIGGVHSARDGKIKVGGNVKTDVTTGNNVNIAGGYRSTASQNIGGIAAH